MSEVLRDYEDSVLMTLKSKGFDEEKARLLTSELKRSLVDLWGGLQVYIPMNDQWIDDVQQDQIMILHRSGMTTSRIAKKFKISYRHANRLIKMKKDGRTA